MSRFYIYDFLIVLLWLLFLILYTIILQSMGKGYSQHMISKVLGVSQPTMSGVIKRIRK